MRTIGIIISALVLLAAAYLIHAWYVLTFVEIDPRFYFENPPKEGYEYWKRVAFFAHLRSFSVPTLILLIISAPPIVSVIRLFFHRAPRTLFAIVLGLFSSVLAILLIGIQIYFGPHNSAPEFWRKYFIIPFIAGSAYAAFVCLRRKEHAAMI